jgi:D-alanyl-D-alanine carboxypeptidase (penicillin-binding protein 5/6)
MEKEWKLELKLIFGFCAVLLLGVLYFYGVGQIRIQEQYLASKIAQIPDSFVDYSPNAKSVLVYAPKSDYILYAHHELTPLPLASLAKIMTSTIALNEMDITQQVIIDEEAYNTYGDNGLAINESWPLMDLVKFMMFISSNDGAQAIANWHDTYLIANDPLNDSTFVTKMNTTAKSLGLASLSFKNPSGLDIDGESSAYGNAKDIASLYYKLYFEHEDVVENSAIFKQTFISTDGIPHEVTNTNVLLEYDYDRIIGSKTGYTSKAGGNLIVLLDTPLEEPVVLVVLGSTIDGRFTEMQKILTEARTVTDSLYSLGLTFENLK